MPGTEPMLRASHTRLLRAALLAFALGLAGCRSVPAECVERHGKALAALQAHDKAAFKALVLPAQRSGPLGLPDGFGLETTRRMATFALDDVLDIQFFSEAKEVTINEDLSELRSDTSAALGATFGYADGMFAVRHVYLAKDGGQWFVDMKTTLEAWQKQNGAAAFSVIGLRK